MQRLAALTAAATSSLSSQNLQHRDPNRGGGDTGAECLGPGSTSGLRRGSCHPHQTNLCTSKPARLGWQRLLLATAAATTVGGNKCGGGERRAAGGVLDSCPAASFRTVVLRHPRHHGHPRSLRQVDVDGREVVQDVAVGDHYTFGVTCGTDWRRCSTVQVRLTRQQCSGSTAARGQWHNVTIHGCGGEGHQWQRSAAPLRHFGDAPKPTHPSLCYY
jgi:hypothetical protein